jgi:hypothetical protein
MKQKKMGLFSLGIEPTLILPFKKKAGKSNPVLLLPIKKMIIRQKIKS